MKDARVARNWNQETASFRLGIARPTLGNIEIGDQLGKKFLKNLDTVYPEEADEIRGLVREFERLGGDSLSNGDGDSEQETELVEVFRRKRQVRPTLAGQWFAIWQTTVDGAEVTNTEDIEVNWKGDVLLIRNLAVSEENPDGGYLWVAKMELFDNSHLLGRYVAKDPNVLSKGTLFLVLHNSGKFLYGKWAGCNYDAEVASGATLFSRSRDNLLENFRRLCYPDAPTPRPNVIKRKGQRR